MAGKINGGKRVDNHPEIYRMTHQHLYSTSTPEYQGGIQGRGIQDIQRINDQGDMEGRGEQQSHGCN